MRSARYNVIHNLMWSGVYLRITFSNDIIQKVLTMVMLTATGLEVYVSTTTTLISDSYASLEHTLNHLKCLKLKNHPGDNFI